MSVAPWRVERYHSPRPIHGSRRLGFKTNLAWARTETTYERTERASM